MRISDTENTQEKLDKIKKEILKENREINLTELKIAFWQYTKKLALSKC